MSNDQDKVSLDNREITREELKRKMQEASEKKGIQIVEVATGQYRTRIQG